MSHADVVREYYQHFFGGGPVRHSEVRSLLTDDFTFRDPLMSADSADAYVDQWKAFGDELEMRADVRVIVGEGDNVGALIDFHGPTGKIPYAQWFTFRDGRIARLESIYDPRPYLAQIGNSGS